MVHDALQLPHSQCLPGRSRLAWLPVPILLVAILIFWAADLRGSYLLPRLLVVLNSIFNTPVSLFVAGLIGRSFLRRPAPGLLLVGCGVVIWGAAGFVASELDPRDANLPVTVFTVGVWLSALCHLAGAMLTIRSSLALDAARRWLVGGYLAALAAVGLVTLGAAAGWTGSFFVDGQGGSPARHTLLASAMIAFVLAAMLLRAADRASSSAFLRWYVPSLLLLAIALLAVVLQLSLGSALFWTGRAAAALGRAYMLLAAIASLRQQTPDGISLGRPLGETRYRYGVAIVIVSAATAVRLAFLPQLGTQATFITFFPAVMMAALYGGLRAGLLATVLSALVADYLWMLPTRQLAVQDPADLLSLAIFLATGAMLSVITQAMQRAQARTRQAQAEARIAAERLRVEEALRLSEEKFAKAFAGNPAAMALSRLEDGVFLDVNDTWVALSGYSRQEIIGASAKTLIGWPTPQDRARFVQELGARGSLHGWEQQLLRRSGAVFLAQLSAQVLSVGGEPLILSTIVDITAHKQAEEDLRKLNRTLRALSHSNQAAMRASEEAQYVRDVCTIIVQDCGHRMAWVGYAREDQARRVEPVAHAGHEAGYLQTAQITWADTERGRGPTGTAIRTGQANICNNMLTDPRLGPWRAEALRRGFASSIALPLAVDGQTLGALTIYSDKPAPFLDEEIALLAELAGNLARGITAIRLRQARDRAEEELKVAKGSAEQAKAAAEAANQAKDHFLAVLSHELRTPLNPALMAATILEGHPQLPPDLREDVSIIRRNVELEARLIDDMLDLTRIARGKIPLARRIVDGREVLGHAIQTCHAEAMEKELVLDVSVPDQPLYVDADPARLQQVFWNLLKNAIKFTPDHGRITVTAAAGERGGLRVQVTDTGRGIEKQALARIFDAFEQGDPAVTKRYGGLGLGLAICKGLLRLHDGSICALSDGPGKGSTFVVELPPPAPQPDRPAEPPGTQTSERTRSGEGACRILLIEDHESTAVMTARLLRSFGHQVTTADCVKCGLEKFAQAPFDLVISDLGLPDGTGHELLRQLLAQRPVPAIALSGYGMDSDIQQSTDAGFLEHLVKPINARQLEAAIDRALGKAYCRIAPAGARATSQEELS